MAGTLKIICIPVNLHSGSFVFDYTHASYDDFWLFVLNWKRNLPGKANMKKQVQLITLLTFFIVISSAIFFSKPASILDSLKKEDDEEEMEEREKESREVKSAFIEARFRYDYSMIKDPGTGMVPGNVFNKEMEEAKTIPTRGSRTGSGMQGADNLNEYIAAGPDSIGGRTRTVVL